MCQFFCQYPMRTLSHLSCVAAFLILTPAARGVSQTQVAANTAEPSPHASARADSSFSSVEKDFTVGKKVYLRSSKTHIGSIIAIDPNHSFPPSFGRTRAKGVLIRRNDGPLDWIPINSALRIYVVK